MPATPPPHGFPDWLAHRAATTPARLALVVDGSPLSFGELESRVGRLASVLSGQGVAHGDRVATLLHNGTLAALLPHALLRLGATLVPLNIRLTPAEVAWQLGDATPALLITDAETGALAEAARGRANVVPLVTDTGLLAAEGVRRPMPAFRMIHPADHVLAIVYTSGTTGHPKGTMLTVGNFWWSAVGSAMNLGSLPSDRWLACLPLFHVGGLSILLRAVIHGFAAEVHEAFDASAVHQAIDDGGVTIVSAVGVMLERMLDARGGSPYPATLRCVLLGGGPAPRALLERAAACGVPVVQTYGLTEATSQVATLAPEDALRKLGSTGRALYPNELRIEQAAEGDGAGEILVRGPIVMAGYAGRPEETARALDGGWLRTGDIGRLDDDGFLYVLDRRDDLVITGGENVYPAEVEAVLLAHPSVLEAAVIGVPHPSWGQQVVAVVRLREGATQEEDAAGLREFCRQRLARFKVPRLVRFAAGPLPRTASGKLRRGALRDAPIAPP